MAATQSTDWASRPVYLPWLRKEILLWQWGKEKEQIFKCSVGKAQPKQTERDLLKLDFKVQRNKALVTWMELSRQLLRTSHCKVAINFSVFTSRTCLCCPDFFVYITLIPDILLIQYKLTCNENKNSLGCLSNFSTHLCCNQFLWVWKKSFSSLELSFS